MTKLPEFYLQELNKLNEDELRELNSHLIERLKLISKAKRIVEMSKFNIGEEVYFMHEGIKITGTIARLNTKSVSVFAEHGSWTVSPRLLFKIT